MFSLLFYLVFLVLSAIHVIVCTSATSSCYLCSLPWLVAGGLMVLVSALLCAIVSTFTRTVIENTLLRKVGCVHIGSCYVGQSSSHQTLVEYLAHTSIFLAVSWDSHIPKGASWEGPQQPSQASGILTPRLQLWSGHSPLFSVEKRVPGLGRKWKQGCYTGWGV